jgi:beta-glucosidase
VVQVYRTVPELTLVGFAKVTLAPGESRLLRIAIDRRRLQVWAGGWTDLPGPLDLLVGRSSADLPFALQVSTN